MAKYKIQKCNNCSRNSRAMPTTVQQYIFIILFACFLIPGIIYWFVSTGKVCHICGVKYIHSK